MDVEHRGQRGDVEHIADAVFRILRSALSVGHGANLPRQIGALNTQNINMLQNTYMQKLKPGKKNIGRNKSRSDKKRTQGWKEGGHEGKEEERR